MLGTLNKTEPRVKHLQNSPSRYSIIESIAWLRQRVGLIVVCIIPWWIEWWRWCVGILWVVWGWLYFRTIHDINNFRSLYVGIIRTSDVCFRSPYVGKDGYNSIRFKPWQRIDVGRMQTNVNRQCQKIKRPTLLSVVEIGWWRKGVSTAALYVEVIM